MQELVTMWWDYVSEDYSPLQPETDEVAVRYIPQIPAAQGMYKCYRGLDLPILKALANVLTSCAGQAVPFQVR